MGCIVLTAAGALWAENVAGVGFNQDGELTISARDGFHYRVGIRGGETAGSLVAAAFLTIIEEQIRASSRLGATLIVSFEADFRVRVETRERITFRLLSRSVISVAADILNPPTEQLRVTESPESAAESQPDPNSDPPPV